MFHKMISAARDQWFQSDRCTIHSLIDYIVSTGQLRDAQIEAIKTYLFLKIGCENKPLALLFSVGFFNSLNLHDVELTESTRNFLEITPAAAALLEYASLKDETGNQVSAQLEKQIRCFPETIDYNKYWRDIFYGVTYTDYLFSLPMGAGKTYLMAAFIYLDLYFALNEPENKAFAHNFIIFAPSGLKSSVVPSLRTIQNFNPAWILPEASATIIKRKMLFEVLDLDKTAKKSNKTKNPNVQKIAIHQPFSKILGLVAVTNAEKVILDRIKETHGQISLLEESDDEKDRSANELRNLIGKLPSLSIFIDEVHHAVSDEIKLRAVVNRWSENRTVNSVIGFSGTPYLEKAEKIKVTENLSVSSAEISNIVYYYPLIDGIGNFLKKPVVKVSDNTDSAQIIEAGVREFLDTYQDTKYDGNLPAKLGIYCGSIEKLEQIVYPIVSQMAAEYGLSSDTVLKFHKGNKDYPQPIDSQLQFDILDKPFSNIRIILLVQIGKEGWDCRSLTGIILSQEGDCPKNMVLQTTCRCLRQVMKDKAETALIYLNESNANKLNSQLEQQHHMNLKEFSNADNAKEELKRYDRTAYLKLPPIAFYQLKISYETQTLEAASPDESILNATKDTYKSSIIKTQDFSGLKETSVYDEEQGNIHASFSSWLYDIARSSFGFISMEILKSKEDILRKVFETITYEKSETCYFSSQYDRTVIEANIRKAFYDKRGFATSEELIPQTARLLNIANFTDTIKTETPNKYYPTQKMVENIILDDNGKLIIDQKTQQLIDLSEETGNIDFARHLRSQHAVPPYKNSSYHYLPYKKDSDFEQNFLTQCLTYKDVKTFGLEIYYNGDRSLTEFQICCYKSVNGKLRYIGMYTPDFLIIQRKGDVIDKAIIVETKGEVYAKDFADKKIFMEQKFVKMNPNFSFLYLEDSSTESERIKKTHRAISAFFKEKN